MSKKVVYIILYVCMLTNPIFGQQLEDVFGDELMTAYERAIDFNEAKNYLGAYQHILLAENDMNATLIGKNIPPSALNDWEFLNRYWPIKKSKAEIAYMLGIYSDMETISNELRQSLAMKKWYFEDDETAKAFVNGLYADLAKIDGSRYYLTEKYDSSEIALKKALTLKVDDDFVWPVHGDLAQLYYKQEKYDKALEQIDSVLANSMFQKDSRHKVSEQEIMIVKSWRAICIARLGQYAEALKEIEMVKNYFKSTNDKRLYAESLRKKAKILMLQYDETGKFDPTSVSCYQDYLSISRNYIDTHFVQMSESEREQYWMAEQPFVTDCFRMEDKAPGLLYDVALYSKAVLLQMGRDFKEGMNETQRKEALASIRITWQQVREKLPASGCAIEFVVYEKSGENHLGALVINKKSTTPRFIGLGKTSNISDYQLYDGLTVKDVFADTQSRDKINALYNDSILRKMVWNDEITNAIGNSNDIYFSPDGLLHQMGIEYMAPPSIAGKHFYRLTTTRLLVQKKHVLKTDKMLICGGVEYGLTVDDKEIGNDELAYSLLASMDLNVSPLPNSSVEIDSIKEVRKNHQEDLILRADSVTEAALNQLLGKYNIVHISTHGLFAEVAKMGTDIRPSSSDMQLSKSCLFLSGSEKNLKKEGYDASQHDGILSARELSKMNMNGVGLTVMSACMSGLGYITPDGVYGLQRGLKTAGVKTIISTLWSVDDEASCFFIIQLYKNLEAGKGLYEAFWSARETLKKYEKTYGGVSSADANGSFTQRRRTVTVPKFNKPYFYNAFILIDGLE